VGRYGVAGVAEYVVVRRKRLFDADLVAAVPDADAVRALYARHVDAVFRFAVRRCRNPEDVADLVSTVFLEMFSAAASYDRRRGGVRVWLLGIAARCLADQRRADYRRAELVMRLGTAPELRGDEHERVERMLDAARLAPSAERALGELTEAERALFLFVAHDQLSVADAARSLGLTPVAGRMRLARARRKLRAAMEPRGHVSKRTDDELRPGVAPVREKP
jgi:RNA polymerase sigma factor (sigma-70 family)